MTRFLIRCCYFLLLVLVIVVGNNHIGVANGFCMKQLCPPPMIRSLSVHRMAVTDNTDSNSNDSTINSISSISSTDDPCWQTMLDDDCSMGNIYAANFVASKWIQSMPCGEGIEDCDMPSALSSPDARPEAGVEQLDVMAFLGLKRV